MIRTNFIIYVGTLNATERKLLVGCGLPLYHLRYKSSVIRSSIYKRLWKWCTRKHPKTGKFNLVDKYFQMNVSNGIIMSPVNRKWHFYGRTYGGLKRVKGDNIKFLVLMALHTKIITARKLAMREDSKKNICIFS